MTEKYQFNKYQLTSNPLNWKIFEGKKFWISPYVFKRVYGENVNEPRYRFNLQTNIIKLGGKIIFVRRKGSYCIYAEDELEYLNRYAMYRKQLVKLNIIVYEKLNSFVEETRKVYYLENLNV
jgi:hypothetical protein